ncbi:MAG: diaminopimelate epimerase [Gammaproteobacteria bacterium]|nr:diaminopimelate epimerase [Rhodocyclaceae bacterium]MBU3910705.1 diaminopimelate epimerase [Gammaproteobacteria bacterium]MBU3988509.1 diaminopimelate epimerase [Gammaproteobacteria bacterium]MBU4003414.1 diaminopimelate epimerase [Gammaproteobacteria bacterium]MBU4021885.1 diaminopimelate epimerase [Gammaproteobacteria bacterium]
MKIHFTKMHGLGNDFVVLDAVRQKFVPSPAQVRWLADRHFGVGCDQLLVVQPPQREDADFRYRIFNADGGEVEQCGNGARCFVRFVHEQGLTTQRRICVETLAGLIVLQLEDDGQVTVDMGVPRWLPADIPFLADSDELLQRLEFAGRSAEITAVSMGNPHAVQVVDNVATVPVARDGPLIEAHPSFPKRVNAGFMEIVDRHAIRLRVFERGAGETLACGTGACAAVAVGMRRGLLDSPVRVSTRGGELTIAWGGLGQPVLMTGPAVSVFAGEIELPEKL